MFAGMKILAMDLIIGAVGVAAGSTVSEWTALATAASAGVYLVCKGIVLIIRELNKGKK